MQKLLAILLLLPLAVACTEDAQPGPNDPSSPPPPAARTIVESKQPAVELYETSDRGMPNFQGSHEFVVTNVSDVVAIANLTCSVAAGTSACVSVSPTQVILAPQEAYNVTVLYTLGTAHGSSQIVLASSRGGRAVHTVQLTPYR